MRCESLDCDDDLDRDGIFVKKFLPLPVIEIREIVRSASLAEVCDPPL